MALQHPGFTVELDWLLGLPLEGEALVTLWAAVEADLAAVAPQTPATRTARAALEQAQRAQQRLNLRGRCLEGDWLAALPPLMELLDGAAPAPSPDGGALGLELLMALHHRLLDPNAPAWELSSEARAELLWQAHALLERLEPQPGTAPERLPVVIEQISRYGAIAWMERPGAAARGRAIRLLLRLAWVNPDAHPWALPALRERIAASLAEQPSDAEAEASAVEPQIPWREDWLKQAITALVGLEPRLQAWGVARLQSVPAAGDGCEPDGDGAEARGDGREPGGDGGEAGGGEAGGDAAGGGASDWGAAKAELPIDAPIRLDLERLQALPLDLASRTTLWRELRARLNRSPEAAGTPEATTEALRRLLLRDQLQQCRDRALQGAWPAAAERIASLWGEAEDLQALDALARLLLELLEPLHRLLITAEKAAPSAAAAGEPADPPGLHPEARAELLWQAHRWQQLIRSRAGEVNGPTDGIRAEITRLGAIAWLERLQQVREPGERLQALIRSQAFLIALAQEPQPCPDWVEAALRHGLHAGLSWLGRGLEPAELLRWSDATIAHALPEAEHQRARALLWPAEAALEVGRALRLAPFTGP